tara:strand:+ start:580 stop:810 length:231 start_codon:yes stop_codon:yes gene_type:complete
MLKIGQRKGAGLSEGHANKSQASDKDLFGAIREELDGNLHTIAAVDATDLASAITLVNEIKASLNASSSAEKKFEK